MPEFSTTAHIGEFEVVKFIQGAFIGVGQVFFASHWLSSILILLGMFVCSRFLALIALVSSIAGAVVGLAFGAPLPQIYFGLWGYNSCLAGIAVYALVGLQPPWLHAALATSAAAMAALCFAGFRALVRFHGIPCFTLPFCSTCLVILAMQPTFDLNARERVKAEKEARRLANVSAGRRASIGPAGRRQSIGAPVEQQVMDKRFAAHRASIAAGTVSDELKNFLANLAVVPAAPPAVATAAAPPALSKKQQKRQARRLAKKGAKESSGDEVDDDEDEDAQSVEDEHEDEQDERAPLLASSSRGGLRARRARRNPKAKPKPAVTLNEALSKPRRPSVAEASLSPELRDAIRAALEAAAGVLSPVQIQLLTSAK